VIYVPFVCIHIRARSPLYGEYINVPELLGENLIYNSNYLIKLIENMRECMLNLIELRANLCRYDTILYAPEALTIWAEYAIYEKY